jgi:hypothetical protein
VLSAIGFDVLAAAELCPKPTELARPIGRLIGLPLNFTARAEEGEATEGETNEGETEQ